MAPLRKRPRLACDGAAAADKKVDAVVAKCIRDNFRTFSNVELDGRTVDGKNFRQRLRDDKKLVLMKADGAPTIGKLYYQRLREMYQITDGGPDALSVRSDEEPGAAWVDAVDRSRAAAPKREMLNDMLQSEGPCKQCEFVGLLTHGLELNTCEHGEQLTTVINIVKYMARNGMDTVFPEETAAFRKQADKALTAVYLNMRAKGLSAESCWSIYRDFARWVLAIAPAGRLLKVTDSRNGCEVDIDQATTTSEHGYKMFMGAVKCNMFGRIKVACASAIQAHLQGNAITAESLRLCRAQAWEGLKPLRIPQAPNRCVEILWLGQSIMVHVDSAFDEVQIRIHAYVKARGLQCYAEGASSPVLQPMFCELGLASGLKKIGEPVADDVLKSYAACRSSACAMISAGKWTSGLHVVEALESREDVLRLLDESITLEVAWFRHMYRKGCAQALEREAMDLLPAQAAAHDAKAIASAIGRLKLSCRYRFGSPESQASVNIVCEWVTAISNGEPPSEGCAEGSEFVMGAYRCLGFFCHHLQAGAECGSMVSLGGAQAITAKFDDLRQSMRMASRLTWIICASSALLLGS